MRTLLCIVMMWDTLHVVLDRKDLQHYQQHSCSRFSSYSFISNHFRLSNWFPCTQNCKTFRFPNSFDCRCFELLLTYTSPLAGPTPANKRNTSYNMVKYHKIQFLKYPRSKSFSLILWTKLSDLSSYRSIGLFFRELDSDLSPFGRARHRSDFKLSSFCN